MKHLLAQGQIYSQTVNAKLLSHSVICVVKAKTLKGAMFLFLFSLL